MKVALKTKVFGREVEVERDWRSRPHGDAGQDRGQAVTRSGKRVSAEAWSIMTQLRSARITAGLTQAEVAKRTGLTQGLIADYEAGRCEPSLGRAVRWAEAVGIAELRADGAAAG